MEKRDNTLREALQNNEDEMQRWENYSKEQKTAIENLDNFSKKLSVDIMVPIGRKALMPGRLIHTNEVMVGHFQDYFSKCSAHTATEICKNRLGKAKQYIDKLEAEREFFENKLEKPYIDGVLPTTEQQEITEEYDEEKERIWREAHKQRVKESKRKEKQERESDQAQTKLIEEIPAALEEQAIMDELNEDLENYDTESNRETQDILSKLMSGEMNLPPPKRRIAHNRNSEKEEVKETEATNAQKNSMSVKLEKPAETSMNIEYFGDDSDMNTEPEVVLIQEQAGYLPKNERAAFFLSEMEIIDGKIASMHAKDEESLKEKMRLLNIRYHLEELIELNEDVPETDSDIPEIEKHTSPDPRPGKQEKRRISFAIEDQMLEFRKNETVAQMMPTKSPTEEKPPRDIIQLDDSITDASEYLLSNPRTRKAIAKKIEENLRAQTTSDPYLVNKILESSIEPQTLHINFKHSTQSPQLACDSKSDIPQSPAHLYELYQSQSEPVIVKVDPKEKSQKNTFVDPRSEFLTPLPKKNTPPENQSKPILKNKSAVDLEKHIKNKLGAEKKKVTKPKKEDGDYLSAYNKVMGNVVENKPDPLPQGKFIDMHIPKKRISRFKQMRNENQ